MFKKVIDFLFSPPTDIYPRGVANDPVINTNRYIDSAPVRTSKEALAGFNYYAPIKEFSNLKANKVAEYVYVALSTLSFVSRRNETAFTAFKYLKKTFKGDFLEAPTATDTQLYRAIHVLVTKNVDRLSLEDKEENEFFFARHKIDLELIQRFANRLIDGSLKEYEADAFFKSVIDDWGITNSRMIYFATHTFDWNSVELVDRHGYIAEIFAMIDSFENENGEIRKMLIQFGVVEKNDSVAFSQSIGDELDEDEPEVPQKTAKEIEDEEFNEGLVAIGKAAAIGYGTYKMTRYILGAGWKNKD